MLAAEAAAIDVASVEGCFRFLLAVVALLCTSDLDLDFGLDLDLGTNLGLLLAVADDADAKGAEATPVTVGRGHPGRFTCTT